MEDNKAYKGVANPDVTKYVIMEFDSGNLRYPVSMATSQVFNSVAEARHYANLMKYGKNKMIVPIISQASDD